MYIDRILAVSVSKPLNRLMNENMIKAETDEDDLENVD